MAGIADTTYYDVVTRYRTQAAGASSDVDRLGRATGRADRSMRGLHGSTRGFGRSLAMAARFLGPVAGGLFTIGAGGMALAKTFRNLNEEMTSSIQMAAQINLAFQFSSDPVDNFNLSLGRSKDLVRGLISDAAKLPGELSDFMQIARFTSGAIFAGGGDIERVRAMTARIALAAPAAGASGAEGGRQTMRALFGTASVGDNPLFAMLQGSGLIANTTTFNAMTAAERLESFDAALKKLTDNPAFRRNVLGTFETQLGTLSDNLFGVEGILGKLGRDKFQGLLDGLTDVNDWLDQHVDDIVRHTRILFGSQGRPAFGLSPEEVQKFIGPGSLTSPFPGGFPNLGFGQYANELERQQMQEERFKIVTAAAMSEFDALLTGRGEMTFLGQLRHPKEYQEILERQGARFDAMIATKRAGDEEAKEDPFKPKTRDAKVEQNITINLEVSTDESPEATAVRIMQAVKKKATHPTVTGRALSLDPTTSTLRP